MAAAVTEYELNSKIQRSGGVIQHQHSVDDIAPLQSSFVKPRCAFASLRFDGVVAKYAKKLQAALAERGAVVEIAVIANLTALRQAVAANRDDPRSRTIGVTAGCTDVGVAVVAGFRALDGSVAANRDDAWAGAQCVVEKCIWSLTVL